MKREVRREILKRGLKKLLFLLLLMTLLVVITSVPVNFNLDYYDGDFQINTTWQEIRSNMRENLFLLYSGKIFQVPLDNRSLGNLLGVSALRSFSVFFFGLLLGLLWGVPKGILDRKKAHKKGTFKTLQKILPFSLPEILVVLSIQMLGAYLYRNQWSPIPHAGYSSWLNMIYPILAISVLPGALIAKTTAEAIQEMAKQPYILVARGKGCSPYRLLRVHYLRGILLEILGAFPTILVMMFSSLVIIERMFYFPGLTYYLVEFYTNSMGNVHRAGIGFTLFIVALGVFYFIIFHVAEFMKSWALPNREKL